MFPVLLQATTYIALLLMLLFLKVDVVVDVVVFILIFSLKGAVTFNIA